MTRYYLDVINGLGLARDQEGEEFPNLAAARDKAAQSIWSILSDELKSAGLINLQGRIEIADRQGSIVLTLPFREAVDIRHDDSSGQEDT
jgi:hypothetical protein